MVDGTPPPMATPRVAAGVLIRDAAGRVLLVKPTYKDGWDIPGGYVEPGESPADACAREIMEEISLDRRPGPLLLVDWAPHPSEGDKLLFLFDGGQLADAAEATPDQEEISEARFHSLDQLPGLMPQRLSDRILTALSGPGDTYAEHGSRVASHSGAA